METSTPLIVTSPYFTAGLVYKERAAPIIKYMIDWDFEQIKEYCAKKGWSVKTIQELEKEKESFNEL